MSTKIVRSLYYILFLVTPLLVFSGTSELFEFNKIIFIYLVTLFIAFTWSINNVLKGKSFIRKQLLFYPFLFFLLSQIAATVFSIDIHTSIFGYYGRFNGGLLSIISYLALFYIFIDYFDHKFLLKLLKFSLLSSVIVILWGLPGKFGYDLSCLVFTLPDNLRESGSFAEGFRNSFNNNCWTNQFRPSERLFSTLGQPNWLGAYLSVNFFIGLFFLYRNRAANIVLILYLWLNFAVILFTRSDSAMGATFIGFLLFYLLFYINNKKIFLSEHLKKTAIVIVGLFVLILVIKTGIPKLDKFITFATYKNLVTTKKPEESKPVKKDTNKFAGKVTDSMDIRLITWEGAINVGKSYPVLGTGVETFAYSYYFKRPAKHNLTSEWDFLYNKAHNEFLNYFATTGTIGLLAYVVMIGAVLFLFIKILKNKVKEENRLLTMSLFCAYVSILITNFFGFSISVINLFFYLIPAFLIGMFFPFGVKKQEYGHISKKLLTVIFSILFIFALSFLIKYYIGDLLYSLADGRYKAGDYRKASEALDIALKFNYEHVYEDKLSYSLANLAYLAYYQDKAKVANKLVILSELYNLKSLKASPKNVNYWKTKAKNYYLFYQGTSDVSYLRKGIDALLQAKLLSPTDPKIPYSLSLYYSLLESELKPGAEKDKYQKLSLQEADNSIKLKPDYEDAYFLKSTLLEKMQTPALIN